MPRKLPTTCNPRNSCGNWARGEGSLPCGLHLMGMGVQTHSPVGCPGGWQGGDPHMSLPTPLAGSFPHAPLTCISMPRFSQHSSFLETLSFRCQGDLAWKDFAHSFSEQKQSHKYPQDQLQGTVGLSAGTKCAKLGCLPGCCCCVDFSCPFFFILSLN